MDHSKALERKTRGVSTCVTDAPPAKASWATESSSPRTSPSISIISSVNEFWDRCCVKHRRKLFMFRTTMRASQRESLPRARYSFMTQNATTDVLKRTQAPLALATMDRKWLCPVVASSIVSIVLLLLATLRVGSGGHHSITTNSVVPLLPVRDIGHHQNTLEIIAENPTTALPSPPRLAYLISGTKGDGRRMQRTLQALYHPRNYYLLHLDLAAPTRERINLARYVKSEVTFQRNGNVYVVGKANLVTYRGPTMVAATLHGAAILLRKAKTWDWFINLSAADYPLVTQDDLLHVFSYLPKDLNFIEHTSDIGWKEFQRVKPIIIDPGLYQNKKTDIFWATQRRAVPTAFRLFTGSAWFALTRSFMEYCNVGWENLPRTLLMYYTNFLSSPEGYFHTVLCNSQEFRNTTVNHDLHYIKWDTPPKQHPNSLTLKDMANMTSSGAAFARKFETGDTVLDEIDETLLNRKSGQFTPGGWCIGNKLGTDPCSMQGDHSLLRPGPGARRFEDLVLRLLSPTSFRTQQCVSL